VTNPSDPVWTADFIENVVGSRNWVAIAYQRLAVGPPVRYTSRAEAVREGKKALARILTAAA
jgi:hypothetical protein